MKKLSLFLLAGLMAACSQDTGREEIRQKIAQYKKDRNALQQKINKLNDRLEEMEVSDAGTYKIPVFVKTMKPDTFSHFINANGTVEAVQDAFISPQTNGQITHIYVEEGDRVEKGALLAKLNTSVIRSNMQEINTNLELARETFEKQKRLWQDSVGSEMQYLEAKNRKENLENRLETLREQLDMSQIRAPFTGIVENISQKVGEMGSPGMQMLHLVNLTRLKVEAELAEQYMPYLQEGDQLNVHFPAYPGMVKKTPISREGSVIDKESRTFTIEARIDNYSGKIKPNQICIVKVRDYYNTAAFFIPSNVIKQDMQGDYVYIVQDKEGTKVAHKVYVDKGRSYNNQTMITEGLEKGWKVITSGYTQVSEQSEIVVKQKKNLIDE